jgi:hypothetical protein
MAGGAPKRSLVPPAGLSLSNEIGKLPHNSSTPEEAPCIRSTLL